MHLVTVVGGRVVAHRLGARLDLDDLGGTQGFQHGIEPLAGPLQHPTQSIDEDSCRRRAQTGIGGVELLLEVFCTLSLPSICRQVQRQLMRNEMARFYHYHTRNYLPPRKLR